MNISYSTHELRVIGLQCKLNSTTFAKCTLPKDICKWKRGKKGGVKQRLRKLGCKPYLPSLILGNVRSLQNKMEELCANVKYANEFRSASLMCFTETWLSENVADSHVNIEGFSIFRADRTNDSGKLKGGGLCVFVNDQWCHPNNITIKYKSCSKNAEIFIMGLRPYYLPREFSHVILTTIYIPNNTVANKAALEISEALRNYESSAPDALFLINGDFNHSKLLQSGNQYYQHIHCTTRNTATLDYCYSNVKDSYSAIQMANLGESDHNLVFVRPKYLPIVQRIKPKTVLVRNWTAEAITRLQGAFECTDWSVFLESAVNINELTESVVQYIKFCMDDCIPTKRCKIYSNNKPWITKHIKVILNRKKQIFGKNRIEGRLQIQRELRIEIRREKKKYKEKIEKHLQENNMKKVWHGVNLMSGYESKHSKSLANKVQKATVEYVNDLNKFYNRFDRHEFSKCADHVKRNAFGNNSHFVCTNEQTRKEFNRLSPSKAAGPDGISPKVLKMCSSQLCEIFCTIFNLSFQSGVVPDIWKTSCIVPVPKNNKVGSMNDLRPVALTSVAFKTCERIVLPQLKSFIQESLDPFQFAYQSNRSCEDALLVTINEVTSHLDSKLSVKKNKVSGIITKSRNSVRMMFFDFSSAFNTIQPHLLANKMLSMSVPSDMILWITDYLTSRSQFVVFQSLKSDTLYSNTGVPQGTVLAPLLFSLYTSDCRSSNESCSIVKFADDTVLIGLISDDDSSKYVDEINKFVTYCKINFLELNVKKTKEMIIDFRKSKALPDPIIINDHTVERVRTYKYLGVMLNNDLSWSSNTDYII